jgi:glucokinase-like ROK family protein
MSKRGRVRTGDQTLVREINLSVIMNQLRQHAPISRAALAEITGLNKTTVSSLVTELIEQHFIHELGITSSGMGRPSVMLELAPDAGYILAAEIGVDFISMISADFSAKIIWQHHETTHPTKGQEAILDRLLALFDEAIRASEECCEARLLGVALGVPGLVDYDNGMLLFAPNLHWENVTLRDLLAAKLDVPIVIDNEANMAAFGEYYLGAAKGHEEVLYISAGVGLGGAIVKQGQLYRGITGFAGEFGHMTMNPDGMVCNCGNRGCWETLVSQSSLFEYIQNAGENGATSPLLEQIHHGRLPLLTVPKIVEAAQCGDEIALQALNRVGRDLGVGIALLVNVLNPDLVVFGGILSLASEFLLPVVELELDRRALRWNRAAARVVRAHHGQDACVIGGMAVVHQMLLNQPTKFLEKVA